MGEPREAKGDDIDIERHIEARDRFGPLLLGNPEFFTTELVIAGNTGFEEVTCIGLNPDQHTLYAVVEVKRESGYGGERCHGPGGREYVRFFVDWDDDGDFEDPGEDVGVASVAVFDVPGPKPLCYWAAVTLTDSEQLCLLASPRRVRAVLMYNSVPPPGNPDPPIVWGNRIDRSVQPRTRELHLPELLQVAKVELAPPLAELVDDHAVVTTSKAPSAADLMKQYGKDVPPHRQWAAPLAALTATVAENAGAALDLLAQLEPVLGSEVLADIDLSTVIGPFLDLDGDTTYEELECVGLNADLSAVVAVVEIKQPSGYSGGLCTPGSQEHVAFWADWDNSGTFDDYLGTVAVRVHDQPVPPGGLRFAVFLPVNLAPYRRPCDASPTARVRGVLSWNTPPSSTSPFATPAWGNKVDALVQLPTGEPAVGQLPFISAVGNMSVGHIDGTGYATGTSVSAGFVASTSPFARLVSIAGHIPNAPDLSAGQPPLSYGLKYRRDGDPTIHDIADAFQVALTTYAGGVWSQAHPTQVPDPVTHRYTYREDLVPNMGGGLTYVEGSILGKWQTLGLKDDRYEIWMEADTSAGTVESNHVFVRLDNTDPVARLAISGSPFVPQGTAVTGTFTATDDHFGSYGLSVLPAGYPHSVAHTPTATGAPAPAGTFTLDTAPGVAPGGYVLHLAVSDRSIVNSGSIGLHASADAGFCVEHP